MNSEPPVLEVVFYKSESGREPVREWLAEFSKEDRRSIGHDLKTIQFGWPIGMPLIRKIEKDLWEVRSDIKDGIVRVLFTVNERRLVLLHGFVKKSNSIPQAELTTARNRRINQNVQ